ncbi:hypothetical protein FGO68_gene9709 [Halteria grandinella]|uniref:Uncharacterized protein n=1 Tax=Halteria grandinella TaxID=5974 RepID=A0A8J8NK89_HALGN|nr:hypothetical protein FGO68_gene9709 [Halteria grandinella]
MGMHAISSVHGLLTLPAGETYPVELFAPSLIYHGLSLPMNLLMLLLTLFGTQIPRSALPKLIIALVMGGIIQGFMWAGLSLLPFIFYHKTHTMTSQQKLIHLGYQIISFFSSIGGLGFFGLYSLF